MPALVPDVGLEWLEARAMDSSTSEVIYEVAVGTGSSAPDSDDTSMDEEVYRLDKTQDNCSIERTSQTGKVRCAIGFTPGLEVSSDLTITEVGVFTDDGTMVYHELREGIELQSGEKIQIIFDINLLSSA